MTKGGKRKFAAACTDDRKAQQVDVVPITFVSAGANGVGQTISPPRFYRRSVQLESAAVVVTFIASQQLE